MVHPKTYLGLESVPKGFQEYRDGKVSAYKIVYALRGDFLNANLKCGRFTHEDNTILRKPWMY
jgi:hypothetical protein